MIVLSLSLFKFAVGLGPLLYSTRSHCLGMRGDARTHTFSATGWKITSFKSCFSPGHLVEQEKMGNKLRKKVARDLQG